MTPENSKPFDPAAWKGHVGYRIEETAGVERTHCPADFAFALPDAPAGMKEQELRVVLPQPDGRLYETPSQFYELKRDATGLAGRVAFFVDLPADSHCEARIYYGNPSAAPPVYPRRLTVTAGDRGPQHRFIENEFFKMETLPKSGQIWHVWNKRGANISWHHHEWESNRDTGGDPCHWAPNCWVAYPERVTNSYRGPDRDAFDWHYVFGWDNPKTEITDGPVFWEMRRHDIVRPHPEHSSPNLRRDGVPKVAAEVVYRFYEGCPFFVQTSDMRTLADVLVFFIRNSQFVFLDHVFTHAIICPEDRDLMPGDEVEPAVIRLMANLNAKPFDNVEHTLSNVMPSKLAYTSFFHHRTTDGFAQFQLLERNTNVHGGEPTYHNHMIFLTELNNWSVYFCRTFSYTNRRYHPENTVWLPKGERHEEANVCLLYRHDNLPDTLAALARHNRDFQTPPRVVPIARAFRNTDSPARGGASRGES